MHWFIMDARTEDILMESKYKRECTSQLKNSGFVKQKGEDLWIHPDGRARYVIQG